MGCVCEGSLLHGSDKKDGRRLVAESESRPSGARLYSARGTRGRACHSCGQAASYGVEAKDCAIGADISTVGVLQRLDCIVPSGRAFE